MRNYLFIFYFWVQKRVNAENKIFLTPVPQNSQVSEKCLSLHSRCRSLGSDQPNNMAALSYSYKKCFPERKYSLSTSDLYLFIFPCSCIVSQNWSAHVVKFPDHSFPSFLMHWFYNCFRMEKSWFMTSHTWNCKPTFFAVFFLSHVLSYFFLPYPTQNSNSLQKYYNLKF